MSPIDQAFLKAFANAGRPSVVAAPASLPVGAAAPARTPEPAPAQARFLDSDPVARPAVRAVSNTPNVSPPRITLSEAIALRKSQRSAVEPPVEFATAASAVSAVETPATETASEIEGSDSAEMPVESPRPTTIARESETGEQRPASQCPDRTVAETIAARLAQLTAQWDATVSQGQAPVAEPLPADTTSGLASGVPADKSSIDCNDNTVGATAEHSLWHPGLNQTLPPPTPRVEDDPCRRVAFARDEEPRQTNRADSSPETEPSADTPSSVEPQARAEPQSPVEPEIVTVANEDAAETAPILRLLRPAIQLERFAWPSLVSRWMRGCGEQLDGVVDALLRAARTEQRIIGFTSCRPGEGVSSVVLATARRLSQRRCRFAVLEGNWDAPQFAQRLALLGNDGWEAVIEGRRDLPDVMVGADEGRAAVVPAMRAPAGKADPARIAETYDVLRQNYEIVLVDLPPRGQGVQCLGPLCDSVVLVQHPRQTRLGELQKYADQWPPLGVGVLGVVQNGLN